MPGCATAVTTRLHYHPDDNEGALSLRLHSQARTATLCMVARKLNIADFLQTQPGMSFAKNDNVLADVIESILAAIYLDSGLDATAVASKPESR